MKKILLVFFTFTILLIHFTSCKKDDPIIDNKGELVSATYQAVSKTFTLTYSSGYKEKVNAVVNSTTTPPTASITLTNGTTIYVEDASVSGNAIINDNSDDGINLVSKFVYDGMEQYYLWAKELNHYGLEIHRLVFDYKSFEFRPRSIKSEQLKLRSLKCRFIPG